MIDILQSIPAGCYGYVVMFALGLFFPQVRLADFAAVFTRTKEPAPEKTTGN